MDDELKEMLKSMRKYIKWNGSNLVSSKGIFMIGKVRYNWNIKRSIKR